MNQPISSLTKMGLNQVLNQAALSLSPRTIKVTLSQGTAIGVQVTPIITLQYPTFEAFEAQLQLDNQSGFSTEGAVLILGNDDPKHWASVRAYHDYALSVVGKKHKDISDAMDYDPTTFSRCIAGKMALSNKFLKGMTRFVPGYDAALALRLQMKAQLDDCGLVDFTTPRFEQPRDVTVVA